MVSSRDCQLTSASRQPSDATTRSIATAVFHIRPRERVLDAERQVESDVSEDGDVSGDGGERLCVELRTTVDAVQLPVKDVAKLLRLAFRPVDQICTFCTSGAGSGGAG